MLFSEFVVEKESNDIYLTRMNSEQEEDPEWKSKLIVDRRIIDKLANEVHTLIEKLRSVPADISTTTESIYGIHSITDTAPPKKLPAQKSSTKIKRSSIKTIFEDRILQFYGSEEGIYENVLLSEWNKYLPGILCFLSTNSSYSDVKRDLLTQVLR